MFYLVNLAIQKKVFKKSNVIKSTLVYSKLDQETWLCQTHLNDLDNFRPYQNQVKPVYKGHPNEFMVDCLDHLGSFKTIEDPLRPH